MEDTFPETVWSSILHSPDSPERREKLNKLCSDYWRPVYKFIRAAWKKSIEDAHDLAQAFFCHVVEGDVVAKYKPDQGRFRHFLRAVLRNFLAEAQRDSERLKRGGGRAVFSLDVTAIETAGFQADLQRQTPEEIFDRQWMRDVVAQSLARLKTALAADGKEDYYRAYEAYEIQPHEGGRPTYDKVAKILGLSPADVKNRLEFVRSRLRHFVTECVADYVTSKEELATEMRELFS